MAPHQHRLTVRGKYGRALDEALELEPDDDEEGYWSDGPDSRGARPKQGPAR